MKRRYCVREVEIWIDGWIQTQASTLARIYAYTQTHTIIGRSNEAVVTVMGNRDPSLSSATHRSNHSGVESDWCLYLLDVFICLSVSAKHQRFDQRLGYRKHSLNQSITHSFTSSCPDIITWPRHQKTEPTDSLSTLTVILPKSFLHSWYNVE